MLETSSSLPRNLLLAALPRTDRERLKPELEHVELGLGASMLEAGAMPGYLYFPTSGIISLLQVMEDGASGELAVIGNEGAVGIALFMGGESTPSRAVVQSAAGAYRLKAEVVAAEFKRGGEMQRLLLRFTSALIAQMSQTAVCNRHHSIHQQLCRWLLMSLDRLPGSEILMTQELIANMLGVRREGVTEAARLLQDEKIIHYVRGRIEVLDRARLEQHACECYGVVKDEYDRLYLSRLDSPPPPTES